MIPRMLQNESDIKFQSDQRLRGMEKAMTVSSPE